MLSQGTIYQFICTLAHFKIIQFAILKEERGMAYKQVHRSLGGLQFPSISCCDERAPERQISLSNKLKRVRKRVR